ncbi:hypothetical protein O0L34_g6949 [Tuta absoluta]|nr:hypothetical protein O0L34_g6949 [Tuta absoluta]
MTKCFTERIILTEFLQMYREFPCLWDNREILYTNREVRQQAYDVLLEKYRQLYDNATLKELKKRLENFRACFRREHKRVLLSKQNGDEFTPTLWYYHMMTFLIDVMDWNNLSLIPDNVDLSFKSEFIDDESSSSLKRLIDPQSGEKPSKMRRLSSAYTQDEQYYEDGQEIIEEVNTTGDQENEINQSIEIQNGNSEEEAFGRTVGLQLKELAPVQKIFAEKLISDIIYHGRLNRLTFDTTLRTE